ncbi:MAG: hypothetical protein ACLP8S_26830 [Solirubrobacteraceae bacterium]
MGKRGVEELTVRAVVDFDGFYAERASAEPDPGERSEEEREREKHAVPSTSTMWSRA